MSHAVSAPLTPDTIVDFIADIFLRRGAESYLGEEVTMSEHMLQAAELALAADAGDALISGALLHDIGHYTNEFPEEALMAGTDTRHETAGAAVLAEFFPEIVVDCVRWHVAAKCYLCATDPAYFSGLSEASIHTLGLQGGAMDAAEQAEFVKKPNIDAILQVRRWDDQGKVKGLKTHDFAYFSHVLRRVVSGKVGKK